MKKSNTYQKITNNKAVWFTNPDDVKYLTNFESSFMEVFLINDRKIVLTDSRYIVDAKEKITEFEVLLFEEAFNSVVVPLIKESGRELIVDADYLTIDRFNRLSATLAKFDIKCTPLSYLGLREIKSNDELDKIKTAVTITDEIFSELVEYATVGMTENDLIKYIKVNIINRGLSTSFDPIVASGPNGAKPHHRGSDRIIGENEMITIDFGLFYEGYASDMTRTITLKGTPTEEEIKIHNIVLESMELAIQAVKPGVKASEIDKIARDYINDQGYGDYFTHSTGHGVGINVHEEPRVSAHSNAILEAGMVITVEPGIYLKDKYGVRIEQDVIVTETGYEQLNKSNKNLEVKNG